MEDPVKVPGMCALFHTRAPNFNGLQLRKEIKRINHFGMNFMISNLNRKGLITGVFYAKQMNSNCQLFIPHQHLEDLENIPFRTFASTKEGNFVTYKDILKCFFFIQNSKGVFRVSSLFPFSKDAT